MSADPLLDVRQLNKSYPSRGGLLAGKAPRFQVLTDVGFTIGRGETLGLIGESGSGKSTTARIIARLLKADSGEVYLNRQEILGLSQARFAEQRRRIQMVFQDPNSSINPRFTMEQYLQEPLIGFKWGSQAQRRQRIREMLPLVGLEESILPRYAHQLSGGQKQRVAILAALLVEPELIIADEIVSALDLSVQAQILNLWRDLQKQLQLATLFISHDLQVVGWLADRIIVMLSGHIVEAGSAADICLQPQHPYTRLLFAARNADLDAEDEAVAPSDAEQGCPFYARCSLRQECCQQRMPERVVLSESHWSRCFVAGDAWGGRPDQARRTV